MPLVPRTVEVPFTGGVDTKTDKKMVIPGKLLGLENARFDGSTIRMRDGSSFLPNGKMTGGSLPDALALSVLGGEMLRWTSHGVYGKASGSSPWVQRADAVAASPLSYSVEPVARRTRSCEVVDCATLSGVTVYVWTEANDTTTQRSLFARVVDEATGAVMQDATLLASSTAGTETHRVLVRVMVCDARLVVAYGVSNGTNAPLSVVTLNPSTPSVFSSPTSVLTMTLRAGRDYPFEFAAVDASDPGIPRFAVAYTGAAGLVLQFVTLSGTPAAVVAPTYTQTFTPSATAYGRPHLFKMADKSRFFLFFYDDNTGVKKVKMRTLDFSFASLAVSDVGLTSTFKATALPGTGATMNAWIQQDGTGQPIYRATWTVSVGIPSLFLLSRGAQLMSGVVVLGSETLLPCSTTGSNQPTVFLLDTSVGGVRARALPGDAGVFGGPLIPSSMVMGSTVAVPVPPITRVEFDESSGVVADVSAVGVARLDVSTASPHVMPRLQEGGTLHVGGASPAYHDGTSWVEDGFHLPPEGLSAVAVSSGGSLSAGTYSWVACYEWTDAHGRLHRSAPSVPVSLTFASASGIGQITVPYLHLTSRQNVRIALYRTKADGIVFQRTVRSSMSYVQPAAPSSYSVTLSDSAADTAISDNELLPYGGATGGSVGGELWHRPAPGYRYAHQHQAHLFVIPMDDPHTIRYTLPLTDGEGPAFADELTLVVPSAHGEPQALATVDDKLLILCERGAYVVYGQGPLRNGLDNSFTSPMYITGSVGCSAPGSVLETPDGLMYAATSGLHLLTRGLETVKLGGPVDGYAGLTFTRAIQMPDTKELRWYTAEGRTLVYSTEWRQWGTWTNQATLDAVYFGGVVHYANGGSVRYDDPTANTEGGAPMSLVVDSAWLKWDGLQGLQRVWKALLLGTVEKDTHISVEVFYDYDDSAAGQTLTKTFQGSTSGGPAVFRLRHTLGKQLCTALRFRWTLTPLAGEVGTTRLTSLTLEFGAQGKPSKRKLSTF